GPRARNTNGPDLNARAALAASASASRLTGSSLSACIGIGKRAVPGLWPTSLRLRADRPTVATGSQADYCDDRRWPGAAVQASPISPCRVARSARSVSANGVEACDGVSPMPMSEVPLKAALFERLKARAEANDDSPNHLAANACRRFVGE